MRLNDLRQSKNPAEFVSRRRYANGKQRIARFCRRDEMANWADSANAGHQRRHLGKRTAFAELLKPAELGNVEASVLHASFVIEMQRDLGVALDPCDRIYNDRFSGRCFHETRLQNGFSRSSLAAGLPEAQSARSVWCRPRA